MDTGTAIIWAIVIILGTIITEYLLNPYFNKLGLPKKSRIEEEPKEKSEEDRKKEEEFYREIWTAKKRKRS